MEYRSWLHFASENPGGKLHDLKQQVAPVVQGRAANKQNQTPYSYP